MKLYTEQHIRDELAKAVAKVGSAYHYAIINNISQGYVWNVLKGVGKPGNAIAVALGYERRVVYVKKEAR